MRTLAVIVAILVVGGVVGAFYAGWLKFSTAETADKGQTEITLTVDKDKVKDDVATVKEKAKEIKDDVKEKAADLKDSIADKAKELNAGLTVEGKIESIELNKKAFTMKDKDGKDIVLTVTEETKIMIGDKEGTFTDLLKGDEASVSYEAKEGINALRQVTVKRQK